MIFIIRTLNLNRETTAILENAYNIGYEKQSNSIWQASFSLPFDDPKVKKVELLKYVEITDDGGYIGLFRIIPKLTRKNSESEYVTFQCEHVLATLLDSSLFQYHQLSNYTTDYVLQYLLDQQKHKHWKLGTVSFTRYFHYSWENENLLSAIFSIPKPFNEQYRWTWDTQFYPWTLNLVKPETEPACRIKEGYNLRGLEIEENPMSVFNRIYPLGAGEGVNQLTIKDVNNGIPYLEDRVSGEEIKETVWADLRFTDAESLKASAQALLDKWKKPIVTWSVDAADVSKITGVGIDKLKEGRVVRLDVEGLPVTDLRIMKETKNDIKGAPGDVQLEIGNVQEDLSTTQADLERRQKVNETYSMGATNIMNSDRVDNADPSNPIRFKVRIPEDAVNVNFMELTWETNPFRGYTKGSESGGSYIKSSVVKSESTKSGGGGTSGPSSRTTSASGGGGTSGPSSRTTSASGGDHRHKMFSGVGFESNANPSSSVILRAANGQTIHVNDGTSAGVEYYTEGSSGDHTHNMDHNHTVPSHTHDMDHNHTVPAHAHSFEVEIPAINIPNHTHPQIYGIYEHDKMPTSLEIKVDGTVIPQSSLQGENVDLIPYLNKDSSGRISRDRYATVEIRPTNELAQITASVIWGLFIRSQKGGNF